MRCEESLQLRVTLINLPRQSGKIFSPIANPAIVAEEVQLSGIAFEEEIEITINAAANCFAGSLSFSVDCGLDFAELGVRLCQFLAFLFNSGIQARCRVGEAWRELFL